MKQKAGVVLMGIFWMVMLGCEDVPEFPDTPFIKLKDIYFLETPDISTPDTIVVELNFQDGDGDLGLTDADSEFPYHATNYFVVNNGILTPISTYTATTNENPPKVFTNVLNIDPSDPIVGKLVTDQTRSTPGNEFIPSNEFPFSCTNYLLSTVYLVGNPNLIDNSYNITDTLTQYEPDVYEIQEFFYIEKNPDAVNITVDFFYRDTNGDEVPFDWVTEANPPSCGGSYDGRYPILFKQEGPLEGVLRYYMNGNGFKPLFGNKTLKLRIQIKDRNLNVSNEVETDFFTLNGIRRN